jgi:flagellar biogenesis protein FliO
VKSGNSSSRHELAGLNGRMVLLLGGLWLSGALSSFGESQAATNYVALPGEMPGTGASVLRVFGALLLVTAIFLGGVWLFRNWQRFAVRKGGAPRLNVIEVKSLGQRHALYVVGYDQQRMLLSSSPAGVTLVSHLPAAEEGEAAAPVSQASFADAFRQILQGKT